MPILALLLACHAVDGDTLRCGRERIRLLAIDAPEMPGHCRAGRRCAPGDPEASKANLQAMLDGSLRIDRVGKDRYGRTLGVVWVGKVNLSCAQLAAGHAVYVKAWDNGRRIERGCQD